MTVEQYEKLNNISKEIDDLSKKYNKYNDFFKKFLANDSKRSLCLISSRDTLYGRDYDINVALTEEETRNIILKAKEEVLGKIKSELDSKISEYNKG